MDELLHHCLRELAFDGDLGCNPSRLRDFIVDFYANNALQSQNTDDAFCGFVWSLVVQRPTVLVGTVPPGLTSEVWIAPQASAKRKALLNGEEIVSEAPPKLDIIPDAKSKTLQDLENQHGERLRIALDPDAIYATITGSHIRFPKLSPMVYSALQIITRGRENGVSVVQLGQRSQYDQKACFYLVRQLSELGLVAKVRRGGAGTSFVIHRYFFDRSPAWKEIRDEETRAENFIRKLEDEDPTDELEVHPSPTSLDFTPIDTRHISSLPLIRGRVIKLLKASKNQMHVATNLLISIGFANPTKADRLFFRSRLRELVEQGIIEKVIVPNKRKYASHSTVPCFRLLRETPATTKITVSPDGDDEEKDDSELGGLKMSLTLHKQMIDLLEEAGTAGMTLSDLSNALCKFDKRTLELLLTRAEKHPPPAHLADLRIISVMESSGRERRHRYYTVSAYRALVDDEKLDKKSAGLADFDQSQTGGFLPVKSNQFYDTPQALKRHHDTFEAETKSGRPRKLNPDGTPKRGRPRKDDSEARPTKRKREADDNGEPSILKKRGRPRKDGAEDDPEVVPKKRGRAKKGKPKDAQKGGKSSDTEGEDENEGNRSTRRKKRPGDTLNLAQVLPDTEQGDQSEQTEEIQKSVRFNMPSSSTPVGQDAFPGVDEVELLNDESNLADADVSMLDAEQLPPQPARRETVATGPDVDVDQSQTLPETQRFDDSRAFHNTNGVGQEIPMDIETPPDVLMDNQDGIADGAEDSQHIDTSVSTLPPSGAKSKKPRISAPKVNVSQLRRENEAFRVLQNLGGLVNLQCKDFYEAHMALLEQLAKTGEPASAPAGTRTDKRTCTATFNALESKGRVKQLRTSFETSAGQRRPIVVVYLPEVTQEQLSVFLVDLGRSNSIPYSNFANARVIEEQVDYGPEKPTRSQSRQSAKAAAEAAKASSQVVQTIEVKSPDDDSTIRQELLIGTTLSQMYGTYIAKCLRVRKLHLIALQALENPTASSYVVSSEKRILNMNFLFNDISLAVYFQMVSPPAHHDEVYQYLSTEDGRNTLLKDLPLEIQNMLQMQRSRSRSRLLELFDMLRSLSLVLPLQPSSSNTPFVTSNPNGSHPSAYDLDTQERFTPQIAPLYWQFTSSAPLYHWAVSETVPPFWKDVSTASYEDASRYWDLLHHACTEDNMFISSEITESSVGGSNAGTGLGRILRRASMWSPRYIFAPNQLEYLNRSIDFAKQTTPLDREDGETQLAKICWVVSAPRDIVEEHYRSTQRRLVREIEKVKAKEKKAKAAIETKASLAKRAAEARKRKEGEWDEMVKRIHPEELSRAAQAGVRRVRTLFLQSVSAEDMTKWEAELATVLQEAKTASKKVFKMSKKPIAPVVASHSAAGSNVPPPVAANPPEKTIAELIASQESQTPTPTTAKTRGKRKRKEEDEGAVAELQGPRRRRFQWNRDYDELCRDTGAIIKARCRDAKRLDWGAFEQVFPALPRNSVRQRFTSLRESPENDAYLNRLEDRWYSLWLQHRGSEILPDEDPSSATNFNLVQHLEFLRKHVDKNALRVGYTEAKEISHINLPASLSRLFEEYDVIENQTSGPSYEFMWNVNGEEGREKKFLSMPWLKTQDIMCYTPETTDRISIAEATLKMVMGTPQEVYDAEAATMMLRCVGQTEINSATKNLLSRGVLSKLVRDPQKQKPGRQFKISEPNQNALLGPLSRDLFQDAVALEEISAQQEGWREWPLLATDGDLAALIQLTSAGKLDFKLDTSQAQASRALVDWNSKKADDDHLETAIYVRFKDLDDRLENGSPDTTATQSMEVDGDLTAEHGKTVDGTTACCRKVVDGAIDCTGCLDDQWASACADFTEEELGIAQRMLYLVGQGRENGVTKQALVAGVGESFDKLSSIIQRMMETSIPLLMWMGYSNKLVLVSTSHIRHWAAVVSEEPALRILPRRWLDIRGERIADVWDAGLKAVMGTLIFRPGITLMELRWRLRAAYDRQELNDLLRHLCEEGFLKPILMSEEISVASALATDRQEEKDVYWVLGDKHWYQT